MCRILLALTWRDIHPHRQSLTTFGVFTSIHQQADWQAPKAGGAVTRKSPYPSFSAPRAERPPLSVTMERCTSGSHDWAPRPQTQDLSGSYVAIRVKDADQQGRAQSATSCAYHLYLGCLYILRTFATSPATCARKAVDNKHATLSMIMQM